MDKTTYFKTAFETATNRNPESGIMSNTNPFLGTTDGRPAFAYVRVNNINGGRNSSAKQQFESINRYAVKEGYKITWDRVFWDNYGRQNLFGRPGVKSMLQEIRKAENRGAVVLVDGMFSFTNLIDEIKKLGEFCLENDNDIFVCIKEGYLLSLVLRIFSEDTTLEQKVKLIFTLGWEDAI